MIVSRAYYPAPIGLLKLEATEQGLKSIAWVEKWGEQIEPNLLGDAINQLQEYFDKKRESFQLLLDWSEAPPFDKQVWEYLLTVPYGRTTSYSAIAEDLGDKNLVRAVGGANARNPLPIVVPCHRVIGKNGDLTGFAYGLKIKAELLGLENPLSFAPQGNLFDND